MYGHFSFPKLSITNKTILFSVLGISGLFLLSRLFGLNAMAYLGLLAVWSGKHFMPWQPLTYWLLNPSIWGLLFNLLALWMFGSVVEQRMGTKRYLITFATAIISSAFIFWMLSYPMNLPNVPYYGMSAGVLALLVSFAYFWPNSNVYVFGIFPVKSKWLVLVFALIMLFSGTSAVAGKGKYLGLISIAKLLGMLISIIYVHSVFLEYDFMRSFIGKFNPTYKEEKKIFKMPKSTRSSYLDKSTAKTRKPGRKQEKVVALKDWERKQVDLLLEKVSKYGIKSLDRREKDFLDRVSSNYSSSEDEV